MHRPRISIIIPAYNEERRIEGALKSIARQHFRDYEIIVVDNGCTDRTAEIASRYAKVIREPEKGISAARNAGAATAMGRILFFMDADARMNVGTLEAADMVFMDNSVAIATGPVLPLERQPTKAAKAIFKFSFNMLVEFSIKAHRPYFVGSNIVIRRSVFDRIHGFDKGLRGCEDGDITRRAGMEGKAVYNDRIGIRMSTRRIDAWGPVKFMAYTSAMVLKYLLSGRISHGYWDENIS